MKICHSSNYKKVSSKAETCKFGRAKLVLRMELFSLRERSRLKPRLASSKSLKGRLSQTCALNGVVFFKGKVSSKAETCKFKKPKELKFFEQA